MASSRLSAAWSPRTRAASLLRSTLPSAVVPGNAASIAATSSPSYSRCTTASASCTGTPSSAKKRAVVDFPMPREPVRPSKNMSGGQQPFPPQQGQQRQQRQSEDREMVAVDAIEQLNAELLHLIGPDARGDPMSCRREVSVEE